MDRAIPALRTGPLPAALVADGAGRAVAGSGAPRGRALAGAALVHVATILLILLLPSLWRELPEPPPLVATLILEPPPPPAPEPPRPRPRPEPRARQSGVGEAPPTEKPAQKERASGADPEQAAAAEAKPAEPSPPAPTPPAPEPAKPEPAPPEPVAAAEAQPEPPKPSPPAPTTMPEVAAVAPEPATAPDAPRVPRQKPPPPADAAPKTALAAPQRPPAAPKHDKNRDPAAEPGDRYLNPLRDAIERHRIYPAAARPLGLQGTAVYQIVIDRAGRIHRLNVLRSSGMEVLDRAGETMIRAAEPFPPPPPDLPGEAIQIDITLKLFPT